MGRFGSVDADSVKVGEQEQQWQKAYSHLVDVGRDGLAAHAHSLAVDGVAVFLEGEAPHHHALFRGNHCRRGGGSSLCVI